MANNVDLDQTAPIGAVCSGSTLFASILNFSVMLGIICSRRSQQTTFSDAFYLGALRVKKCDSYCQKKLDVINYVIFRWDVILCGLQLLNLR